MTLYSQRDPRWRAVEIGDTKRTLGQVGCVVTSIAMLCSYFKPDRTPPELLKKLIFTPDARLIWQSCNFENFKFHRRIYQRNDENIRLALTDPKWAVILEVADKTHWVVVTGVTLFKKTYKIADPLFGDRATMNRYQNNITGAAFFKKK